MTEQEWMTIYRETVRDLYGYVARRTGGLRELSEDIVQETYLRALGDWRTKPLPASPLAWLKRVAHNILVDFLRQRKWIRPADADFSSEAGADHPGGGLQALQALEIGLAVSSLGRKKAAVIEAFYYDGMSVKEIASSMSVSERAVEGLLRRARRSLKAQLPERKSKGETHESPE